MSTVTTATNSNRSANEGTFQAVSAPHLAPVLLPLAVQRGQAPVAAETEGSLPRIGAVSVSQSLQEPLVGQGAAETTASERSNSGLTAADGQATAVDANVCDKSSFLSPDHDNNSTPMKLTFCTADGFESQAGERPAGSSTGTTTGDEALAGDMNGVDPHGCSLSAEVAMCMGSAQSNMRQGQPLSLHTQHQSLSGNEGGGVSNKKQNWQSNQAKESHASGALQGPSSQRRSQEGQRGGRRSLPSGVTQGTKARAGDTTDQVYKFGLLLRQLGRLGKVRSCWEIWQEMVNTEGRISGVG